MFLKNREPDFVNNLGTKWWKDHESTHYAQKENAHGVALPNIQAWIVETTDGVRSYVLVDTNIQGIVYTTQLLESLGIHIDMLKYLEQDNG